MMGWSGLAASGAQRSGQARGCVRGPSGQECAAMAVAASAVRPWYVSFSPRLPPGRVQFFFFFSVPYQREISRNKTIEEAPTRISDLTKNKDTTKER